MTATPDDVMRGSRSTAKGHVAGTPGSAHEHGERGLAEGLRTCSAPGRQAAGAVNNRGSTLRKGRAGDPKIVDDIRHHVACRRDHASRPAASAR